MTKTPCKWPLCGMVTESPTGLCFMHTEHEAILKEAETEEYVAELPEFLRTIAILNWENMDHELTTDEKVPTLAAREVEEWMPVVRDLHQSLKDRGWTPPTSST